MALVILILSILYLNNYNVGKALAIVGIVTFAVEVCNGIVRAYQKTTEEEK